MLTKSKEEKNKRNISDQLSTNSRVRVENKEKNDCRQEIRKRCMKNIILYQQRRNLEGEGTILSC